MALLHNLLTVLLSRLEGIGCPEQKILDRAAARVDSQPPSQRVPAQEIIRHAHALTCQYHPAGPSLPALQNPLAARSAPFPSTSPALLMKTFRTPLSHAKRVKPEWR
jgi:hypothetical protein